MDAIAAQADPSPPVVKSITFSGHTLTIQAQNFPKGPLNVQFNGVAVTST